MGGKLGGGGVRGRWGVGRCVCVGGGGGVDRWWGGLLVRCSLDN